MQNYRKLLKPPNVLHHFSHNIYNPVYYVKMMQATSGKRVLRFGCVRFYIKDDIEEIVEFRTFCVKFPILQADFSENIWRLQIKSVSLQHQNPPRFPQNSVPGRNFLFICVWNILTHHLIQQHFQPIFKMSIMGNPLLNIS